MLRVALCCKEMGGKPFLVSGIKLVVQIQSVFQWKIQHQLPVCFDGWFGGWGRKGVLNFIDHYIY